MSEAAKLVSLPKANSGQSTCKMHGQKDPQTKRTKIEIFSKFQKNMDLLKNPDMFLLQTALVFTTTCLVGGLKPFQKH